MTKRFAISFISLLFIFQAFVSFASPRVLILSGGGDPVHNNYSQYLQTKALADHLRKRFGKKNVDVFFGAGNSGAKNGKVLPDVNAKITDEKTGRQRVETVYGAIKHNKPGTKAAVTSYLKNDLPKKVKADDTFFLFVSDHGLPNPGRDDYADNCIHLWSYDASESPQNPSWQDMCLSKSELKNMIEKDVPARRTVFAMSQCYSGGFHQMSVEESGKYPEADARVCGFTSAPEDLMASGCTDDVQADRYQGYERYFTEELSGRDIVTGKKLRGGRAKTVEEAHARAVLRDATVDVPMSTSDYYLQAWYYALWEGGFKPRAGKTGTAALRAAADEMTAGAWDEEKLVSRAGELGPVVIGRLRVLQERLASLAGFHPELKDVLERGSDAELESKSEDLQRRLDALDDEYGALNDRYWRLRYEALFKPWFAAVRSGRMKGLSEEELNDFEIPFFGELENGYGGDPLTDLGIQQSAIMELSALTAKDPKRAKRFAAYLLGRDAKMFAWAMSSGDRRLTDAAARLKGLKSKMEASDQPSERLSRQIAHVRRVKEARQQLAAAVILAMMGDEKAIGELKALENCENTRF